MTEINHPRIIYGPVHNVLNISRLILENLTFLGRADLKVNSSLIIAQYGSKVNAVLPKLQS